MTGTARLLAQRSVGHVQLRMEQGGIAELRESGSAKCRIPRGSACAVLINTGGGLAGGDRLDVSVKAGDGAKLTLTTQAAERVYRTLGPAAEVTVRLSAGHNAQLCWLPQETIVFEGSALNRSLDVDLAEGATLLAVEPVVFGRQAMGERVTRVSLADRWNVRQAGRLIHMEAMRLGPDWPAAAASFGDHAAMATVLMISGNAAALLDRVRGVLGPHDGASAWNGKLVARLLASDAFALRKALIPVLALCASEDALPKFWML